MSKFKVLFDYRKNLGRTRSRTKDTTSIELGPWLDDPKNKESIWDMRLFYVLKPNSEDVVKFGIAGTKGESGAWGRLHQYINEYGYTSDLNRCMGIQMLYLAGNKYNKNVEITNSDIYKKELACKQYFRSPEVDAHLLGRGFERINLDRIAELFDIIDDPSNKSFGDVETQRRQSQRAKQQILTDEDEVLRITSHKTLGGKSQALTKYRCYWNRPAVLTKEVLVNKASKGFKTKVTEKIEDHETDEFAKNILLFKGGEKALEVYKILHPTGKFRD